MGCFDPLHIGHVKHLKAAKKLGDWLIVGLTADVYVRKGPGRPAFPETEREEMLRELRCVDDVAIVRDTCEAIMTIRPDYYVKGKEYVGKLPEQSLVESFGGKVVFTDEPVYSSTALLSGRYLKVPGAVGW